MSKHYGRVALVTGAASGVGKYIADRLAKDGYRVYGTSRKVMAAACEQNVSVSTDGGFVHMLYMDICDEETIKKAVSYIVEREGHIGILVNNAGIVSAGAVEDTSADEAFSQFNTNFFGTHRVLRHVLPVMRMAQKGMIINVSSVNGFITLPFQSMYCASKYALEAMTEALRMEVKPYGIKVTLIEPGDMKTGNTFNRTFASASKTSVYSERFIKSMEITGKNEQNGPEPFAVGGVVAKLVRKKNPPVRIVIGFQYKLISILKRIIPARLVLYIVSKLY